MDPRINSTIQLTALDLTHVLYDPTSNLSLALALVTLAPILLMACYGALSVVTRDLLILNMWAGQLGCEGFNAVLKHLFKEERPSGALGTGYGFPSSHSQFMGYFISFLLCHLFLRHKFQTTGLWLLDALILVLAVLAVVGLAAMVCYSRFYLGYHTIPQIGGGFLIGAAVGIAWYLGTEYLPHKDSQSLVAQLRRYFLRSSVATWFRIVDKWGVWGDGGHEDQYKTWRALWEMKQHGYQRKNTSRLKSN